MRNFFVENVDYRGERRRGEAGKSVERKVTYNLNVHAQLLD